MLTQEKIEAEEAWNAAEAADEFWEKRSPVKLLAKLCE